MERGSLFLLVSLGLLEESSLYQFLIFNGTVPLPLPPLLSVFMLNGGGTKDMERLLGKDLIPFIYACIYIDTACLNFKNQKVTTCFFIEFR